MTAAVVVVEENDDNGLPIRPPLKYAGGKNHLLPRLRALYEPHRHRRLVEPFCGALNVALGLRPERALLNDSNRHLMNFHRWVMARRRPRMRFDNDERRYYLCRDKFNRMVRGSALRSMFGNPAWDEAAELFYYFNRTGFNGLCRFNAAGEFNVPFGRYKSIRYVRDFSPWAQAMAGWAFSVGDFAEVGVGDADDAWLYADPPYDVPFVHYAAGGFSWKDQERLAAWLAGLGCPVVASNQATPRILRLYRGLGFRVRTIAAPRNISCDGDRTPAREMLATRNL